MLSEEEMRARYQAWLEHVKATAPPERLRAASREGASARRDAEACRMLCRVAAHSSVGRLATACSAAASAVTLPD